MYYPRLKDLREDHDLVQKEIAAYLSIDQRVYSNYETGKREMIRAVLEGVCYHLRWFIETEEKKVKTSDKIRFVGGGALSDLTCQILADCTGKTVETVSEPQNAGAMGARLKYHGTLFFNLWK